MRTLRHPVLPLFLCVAALLACKKGKTVAADASTGTPGTASAQPSESEAPAVAIKPGANQPGPAYFAVKDTGIVMLDGGVFKTVQPLKYSVKRMVYGADGAVWVTAIDGAYRIVGAKSQEVNPDGDADGIAPVSAKEAWAVSYKGIFHYTGAAWALEDKKVLGDVTLLRDVAVDGEGTVWVMSSNLMHQRKKGASAWVTVDVSKAAGAKPFFHELGRAPDGTLYASHSSGLIVLRGGEWTKVAGNFGFSGTEHLDVSPTGVVAAVGGLDKLYVVQSGAAATPITAKSSGANASRWEEVAIDGSGRIWLATDQGVVVLDGTGQLVTQWAPGTVEALRGEITHLVVAGSGPAQLPAAGAAATGTVTGKIIKDGSPVVGAEVQVCNSPSMVFSTTPCEDKPFKQTVKTDASGAFKVPGVPIGTYGFAIRAPGGKWLITLSSDCCTQMKKGQEYDVGSIKLDQ